MIEKNFRRMVSENQKQEIGKKIELILTLLIGAELARLVKEKQINEEEKTEIMDKMTNLEAAEIEIEDKISPEHGAGMGITEMTYLFDNPKCPEDFKNLLTKATKNISKEEIKDFAASVRDFLFDVPAEKRQQIAQERHGKPVEKYYLEYLLKKHQQKD